MAECLGYNELRRKEQAFVDYFLSYGVREPRTQKLTFNDNLWSYVAAFNANIDDVYEVKYSIFSFKDSAFVNCKEYVDGCKITITIKDMGKFRKLKKRADAMYLHCLTAINNKRKEAFTDTDKTREQELKDAIHNSAMYSEDAKDRNENRKMAMKMYGLDNVKIDVQGDIYTGMGKNLIVSIKQETNPNGDNPDAPYTPDDIDLGDNE